MDNWIKLGYLDESDNDFSKYSESIGIYKAVLNNKIMYIGKATELKNGGFRKRLRDYTRVSNSARNYSAGKMMYEHKSNIVIEIFIVEQNAHGIKKAEELEKNFIKKVNPKWNSSKDLPVIK